VPLYNLLAVVLLVAGQHRQGQQTRRLWRRLGVGTVTNPLILACVAGLLWAWTGQALPTALERAAITLGQMALPLALLGLGTSLRPCRLRGRWAACSTAAAIKLVGGPLAGAACGAILAVPMPDLRIALLYLACPTAVLSYVMVCELGGDEDLAAGIVVITTITSAIALGAVLLLTRSTFH
jgi:predicted permease